MAEATVWSASAANGGARPGGGCWRGERGWDEGPGQAGLATAAAPADEPLA